MKRTDAWYKSQPEWGSKESTKKAKKITPGESKLKSFKETIAEGSDHYYVVKHKSKPDKVFQDVTAALKHTRKHNKTDGGTKGRDHVIHKVKMRMHEDTQLDELSRNTRRQYQKKAQKSLNKSLTGMHKADNKSNKLIDRDNYGPDLHKSDKAFDKAKATAKKRAKGLKRSISKDISLWGEEVAAGANTGSIPNPAVTVQGSKKKKYSILTRHYMEIGGKRRKRVK